MTVATLDSATFDYVRTLVQERSAIALESTKGYLVESRLAPIAKQHGHASLADMVAKLRDKPFGDLHLQVVEAMTTNETSFFRDAHPFEALRAAVLPELIQKRDAVKTLNIWSAACSTGQEPYTIAITLREYFPQLANWNIKILATDLSSQVLEKAATATYSQAEINRGLPAPILVKYFQKSGLQWQLKPEIRQQVQFQRMNLIEPWPAFGKMDIVFLRNVLIYFTPETKSRILANMRGRLAAGGTLFLGGAETTIGIDDSFERVNHGKTITYRSKS